MKMKNTYSQGFVGALAGFALLFGTQAQLLADEKELKAHGPIQWTDSLEKAKKIALKTHKPIMMDFWATWCGPCKQMLATTYKDKKVLEKSKQFVPVLINVDESPDVAKKFKIDVIPVLLFLDSKGKIIEHSKGFQNSEDVLKMMSNAIKKNK